MKAIANYKQLVDSEPKYIKAFFYWVWTNSDQDKLNEDYENRPEKFKNRHKKSLKNDADKTGAF